IFNETTGQLYYQYFSSPVASEDFTSVTIKPIKEAEGNCTFEQEFDSNIYSYRFVMISLFDDLHDEEGHQIEATTQTYKATYGRESSKPILKKSHIYSGYNSSFENSIQPDAGANSYLHNSAASRHPSRFTAGTKFVKMYNSGENGDLVINNDNYWNSDNNIITSGVTNNLGEKFEFYVIIEATDTDSKISGVKVSLTQRCDESGNEITENPLSRSKIFTISGATIENGFEVVESTDSEIDTDTAIGVGLNIDDFNTDQDGNSYKDASGNDIKLTNGIYTLKLYAVDEAGNISDPVQLEDYMVCIAQSDLNEINGGSYNLINVTNSPNPYSWTNNDGTSTFEMTLSNFKSIVALRPDYDNEGNIYTKYSEIPISHVKDNNDEVNHNNLENYINYDVTKESDKEIYTFRLRYNKIDTEKDLLYSRANLYNAYFEYTSENNITTKKRLLMPRYTEVTNVTPDDEGNIHVYFTEENSSVGSEIGETCTVYYRLAFKPEGEDSITNSDNFSMALLNEDGSLNQSSIGSGLGLFTSDNEIVFEPGSFAQNGTFYVQMAYLYNKDKYNQYVIYGPFGKGFTYTYKATPSDPEFLTSSEFEATGTFKNLINNAGNNLNEVFDYTYLPFTKTYFGGEDILLLYPDMEVRSSYLNIGESVNSGFVYYTLCLKNITDYYDSDNGDTTLPTIYTCYKTSDGEWTDYVENDISTYNDSITLSDGSRPYFISIKVPCASTGYVKVKICDDGNSIETGNDDLPYDARKKPLGDAGNNTTPYIDSGHERILDTIPPSFTIDEDSSIDQINITGTGEILISVDNLTNNVDLSTYYEYYWVEGLDNSLTEDDMSDYKMNYNNIVINKSSVNSDSITSENASSYFAFSMVDLDGYTSHTLYIKIYDQAGNYNFGPVLNLRGQYPYIGRENYTDKFSISYNFTYNDQTSSSEISELYAATSSSYKIYYVVYDETNETWAYNDSSLNSFTNDDQLVLTGEDFEGKFISVIQYEDNYCGSGYSNKSIPMVYYNNISNNTYSYELFAGNTLFVDQKTMVQVYSSSTNYGTNINAWLHDGKLNSSKIVNTISVVDDEGVSVGEYWVAIATLSRLENNKPLQIISEVNKKTE
ncbi:MAG: hypothetical protein K5866_10030, partial [Treponema sp.]|nr:hypothetical protein [Treponema sp.]